MSRKQLFLEPVATGLVVANLIVIGVAIACVLVTRRAWQLRDDALAALHDAQTQAATAHPPVRRLRASTMDRILLCGGLGVAGSAYFTWLLVTRSFSLSRLRERAGVRAGRPGQRSPDVRDRLRRGRSVTGAERTRP